MKKSLKKAFRNAPREIREAVKFRPPDQEYMVGHIRVVIHQYLLTDVGVFCSTIFRGPDVSRRSLDGPSTHRIFNSHAMKLAKTKNYARWYKHDEIYNMHWYYYSGPSAQKCMDSLLHTLSRDWPWDVGAHANSAGVCYSVAGTRACMIWTPDHKPAISTIVHEIFHMITFLAAKMEAVINESNEEFFSQYQEFLYIELVKVIESGKAIYEIGKK